MENWAINVVIEQDWLLYNGLFCGQINVRIRPTIPGGILDGSHVGFTININDSI
jgi:hypothetical protein